MRPNVALGASNAPNVAFGALDAPNATLGRLGPALDVLVSGLPARGTPASFVTGERVLAR